MWSEIIIHTCTCTVSNPETVCTRFFGVTSENLNSILRRTLVVKFRAVFHDQFYIAAHAVEPEKHGIFVRDPTLKDFLKSGPACLATLRVLWQFAGMYSAEECRQVLEDYVMNGGDDGLTEACVRIACNLPAQDGAKPKDDRALNTQQAAAAEDPKQAVQLQQQEELQRDGSSQRRLSVLIRMIQEKGGKLSSRADKLFSSEEGSERLLLLTAHLWLGLFLGLPRLPRWEGIGEKRPLALWAVELPVRRIRWP